MYYVVAVTETMVFLIYFHLTIKHLMWEKIAMECGVFFLLVGLIVEVSIIVNQTVG